MQGSSNWEGQATLGLVLSYPGSQIGGPTKIELYPSLCVCTVIGFYSLWTFIFAERGIRYSSPSHMKSKSFLLIKLAHFYFFIFHMKNKSHKDDGKRGCMKIRALFLFNINSSPPTIRFNLFGYFTSKVE